MSRKRRGLIRKKYWFAGIIMFLLIILFSCLYYNGYMIHVRGVFTENKYCLKFNGYEDVASEHNKDEIIQKEIINEQ